MVNIDEYSDILKQRFINEKNRIKSLIPNNITIEHVGSSAVGIGGKNIVDILVGVSDKTEMRNIRDILVKNGYHEGNDSHDNRIFLASREEETKEGDFHIHICLTSSDSYKDFIILRDFLIANPYKAYEYLEKNMNLLEKLISTAKNIKY